MKHLLLPLALLVATPAFAAGLTPAQQAQVDKAASEPAPPPNQQAVQQVVQQSSQQQQVMIATLADRLQQEMGQSIQREVALREQIATLQGELAAAKADAPKAEKSAAK